MPIEFTMRINKKGVLSEEMLINEIRNLGFADIVEIPEGKKVFVCESCYDSLGFLVSLIKSSEPPYNAVDTIFFEGDFEYEQVLCFRFNKELELSLLYEKAMKMILSLMKNTDSRALLTTSMFVDLCFFNDDKSIIINKSCGIWDNINVQKELSEWSVQELEFES